MRLENLRLSNFRNAEFADIHFSGLRTFLFGENGQGKTNLLEALSLLTALRSFRTRDTRQLIRHGEKISQIAIELGHEAEGATRLIFKFSSTGTKSVELGAGTPIKKMNEFVGRFPVVVFSSDDILLLRGAPGTRRRWFDIMFSALEPEYLSNLQRYYRALESRNKILKSHENSSDSGSSCRAFEKILAETGTFLVAARERGTRELNEEFATFAERILSAKDSAPQLSYIANIRAGDASEWETLFDSTRKLDEICGATQKGVHRDDYSVKIFGRSAADFASEGQQRGLALALGLAQLALFRRKSKIAPIVLADDVLNELDPKRRENFWREVGNDLQVIATGTQLPEKSESWQVYSVKDGNYEEWKA